MGSPYPSGSTLHPLVPLRLPLRHRSRRHRPARFYDPLPLLMPERLQIGIAHCDAETRRGSRGPLPEVGGTRDVDGSPELLGRHAQGSVERSVGLVVHLDPGTGIAEEQAPGVVPVVDPLAVSVDLGMEGRQNGLQGFQILAFNTIARFVLVALFLVPDASEGRSRRAAWAAVSPCPACCSSQVRQT